MFMLFTHICYKLFESVSHPKKDVNTSKKWPFFHFVCTYSQNVKLCLFWYTHSHSRRGAFCHLAHPKICKFLPPCILVHTVVFCVCACYNYYACMSFIIIYVFIKKKIKCVHYMLLKTSIFSHLPVPTSKTRNFTISGTPTSTFDGVQIFIWWTRNV